MSSVCNSQDEFNVAVKNAVEYTNKQEMKKVKPWIYVYLILWIIFVFWGVMLALKVRDQNHRIIHLVFAIACPPVYVLSHYIGTMNV